MARHSAIKKKDEDAAESSGIDGAHMRGGDVCVCVMRTFTYRFIDGTIHRHLIRKGGRR